MPILAMRWYRNWELRIRAVKRNEILQTDSAQRIPQRLLHGIRHGVGIRQGGREGAGLVRQKVSPPDRPQRFFRRLCSDRGHHELVGTADKIKNRSQWGSLRTVGRNSDKQTIIPASIIAHKEEM